MRVRRVISSKGWKERPRIFQSLEKAVCLAAALAALALPARAGELLGTNEEAHLHQALAWMNMTVTDLGFNKDVGTPVLALQGMRNLLGDPLALPALGDRVLAVATNRRPQSVWALARELLETGAPAEAPAGAASPPPWEGLSNDLAAALTDFYRDAEKAHALLDRAFNAVSGADQQYLAAAYLAGQFNAEDRPEVRRALEGAGMPAAQVERAIRESKEIDPEPSSTNFLAILRRVELPLLLAAGELFQGAVSRLAVQAGHIRDWPAERRDFVTPIGNVVIGSPKSDAHTSASLLVLDPDGSERYANDAGSANGLWGRRLSAVIDLKGDDTYAGRGMVGPGTALWGVAVLSDLDGDDAYRADFMGEGAAVFGAAWVADRAGNDSYRARAHAQGAGYAGAGFLFDGAGDDTYDVGLAGQGFAGVLGVGLLVDRAGNDLYLAGGVEPDYERHEDRFITLAQGFSIGLRPFAGGGVGALVDLAGNDTYKADIFGQGASYWYSAGLLIDAAGNDTYSVYQYGQGSGIHLSSGLLADLGGKDSYSGHTLVQGCAHDYGVGVLLDRGGNDTYTAVDQSQGRAMNTALAILVDSAGDDSYFARDTETCQGIGNSGDRREYGSIGLMLDLAGRDHTSCGAEDGARMLRPDFGIVYDVETTNPH